MLKSPIDILMNSGDVLQNDIDPLDSFQQCLNGWNQLAAKRLDQDAVERQELPPAKISIGEGHVVGEDYFRARNQLLRDIAAAKGEVERLQNLFNEHVGREREALSDDLRRLISRLSLTERELFPLAVQDTPSQGKPSLSGDLASMAPLVPEKYRSKQGETWSGRGRHPKWLKEALRSGRTLDEFAV
jgi:DNA-binding protein H-NS